MNNTFNINRFGLLIRKQWLEYGKLYLIALGILVGILLAIYSYMYWQAAYIETGGRQDFALQLNFRWLLFGLFGILFITLAANHYFAPLSQKPKAILELTLPASSLEKFLAGILFSTILALICYLLIFYLVDLAFVTKLRSEFPLATSTIYAKGLPPLENHKVPTYFFDRLTSLPPIQLTPIAGSILISSIFLIGSLFFEKFQFIKSVITILISGTLWLMLVINFQEFIFKNTIAINNHYYIESRDFVGWSLNIFLILLATIIYIIAYIRFKEKEV